jgi:hypothetical protein
MYFYYIVMKINVLGFSNIYSHNYVSCMPIMQWSSSPSWIIHFHKLYKNLATNFHQSLNSILKFIMWNFQLFTTSFILVKWRCLNTPPNTRLYTKQKEIKQKNPKTLKHYTSHDSLYDSTCTLIVIMINCWWLNMSHS